MRQKSDVKKYANAHPDTTELLPSGKLKFVQTGMEFSATATTQMLERYAKKGLKRALLQKRNANFDFSAHLPYVKPHPKLGEKNFLLCTLTNSQLPRDAAIVGRHVNTKRFLRLKEEAEAGKAARVARAQKARDRRRGKRAEDDQGEGADDDAEEAEGDGEGEDEADAESDDDDRMDSEHVGAVLQEIMSDSEDEDKDDDMEEEEGEEDADPDGEEMMWKRFVEKRRKNKGAKANAEGDADMEDADEAGDENGDTKARQPKTRPAKKKTKSPRQKTAPSPSSKQSPAAKKKGSTEESGGAEESDAAAAQGNTTSTSPGGNNKRNNNRKQKMGSAEDGSNATARSEVEGTVGKKRRAEGPVPKKVRNPRQKRRLSK